MELASLKNTRIMSFAKMPTSKFLLFFVVFVFFCFEVKSE